MLKLHRRRAKIAVDAANDRYMMFICVVAAKGLDVSCQLPGDDGLSLSKIKVNAWDSREQFWREETSQG
eukprot:scaffold1813_cov185-Alexandrium_tamarense.AAC.10